MTSLEHLFETAIDLIESNQCYNDWVKLPSTKANNKNMVYSRLVDIWSLAQYAVFSYKPSIVSQVTSEMEEKYGYKVVE